MKLRKVKTEAEARAAMKAETPGREPVEFTTKDGAFSGLRIGQLHIIGADYSGTLNLHRESLFDEATRYRVTAKAPGFADQVHYFEDYSDATDKRDSFGAGADVSVDSSIKVLVDADGNVARELGEGDTGDALPF